MKNVSIINFNNLSQNYNINKLYSCGNLSELLLTFSMDKFIKLTSQSS